MAMSEDPTPNFSEPSVEIVYPTAQQNKSPLSEFAPEVKELLRNDPEAAKRFLFVVLDGIKTDQEIRRDQQNQLYAITQMREKRLDRETVAKKNTNRLIMGAITFAFAGSLGYGFIYKDTGLAEKIITNVLAAAGGAGSLALSQKKSKDSD
jgi:hypothetical protein